MHLLKVSGAAALPGEAITDHHSDGKYDLTKSKDEVSYYRKRAETLLESASPLMDIYRKENSRALTAFLLSDSHTKAKQRNLLSSLPLYTMKKEYLEQFLKRRKLFAADRKNLLAFADTQRKMMEGLLSRNDIEDEISLFTKEELECYPMVLSLSGMFYETDISYTPGRNIWSIWNRPGSMPQSIPAIPLLRRIPRLSAICRSAFIKESGR